MPKQIDSRDLDDVAARAYELFVRASGQDVWKFDETGGSNHRAPMPAWGELNHFSKTRWRDLVTNNNDDRTHEDHESLETVAVRQALREYTPRITTSGRDVIENVLAAERRE